MSINLIRALHDAEQHLHGCMRSMKEAQYQLEDSTDALSLQALGSIFEVHAKYLNDLRTFYAGRAKEIRA